MKWFVMILVLTSVVCSLCAEMSFFQPTPSFNPNFNLGGFLHPDKLRMNHTMSFMSGVSSRGDGFYQSAYTNHLQFDLRTNLKFNVDISFVNLGTMSHNNDLKFSASDDNHNMIVPSFSLEYKPTDSTTILFQYQQVRGYVGGNSYNRYNPYNPGNEWWR